MERRLKLSAEAARYLDDPKEYVFGMGAQTYVWLDNLLYLEALAKRGKAGYTEIYYESFEQRCGQLLRDRWARPPRTPPATGTRRGSRRASPT
jgi:hypothetical protein